MKHPFLFKVIAGAIILSVAIFIIPGCRKNSSHKNVGVDSTWLRDFTYETTQCFYSRDTIKFIPNDLRSGTTYLWQFGDGETSADARPKHAYAQPGNYTVRLSRNNDAVNDSVKVITIRPTLSAVYTFSLNATRSWDGVRHETGYGGTIVNDSLLPIQVIDSGTISFMGYTMRMVQLDMTGQEMIIFSHCTTGSYLYYYYQKDSIYCRAFWPVGHGGGSDLTLQSIP